MSNPTSPKSTIDAIDTTVAAVLRLILTVVAKEVIDIALRSYPTGVILLVVVVVTVSAILKWFRWKRDTRPENPEDNGDR